MTRAERHVGKAVALTACATLILAGCANATTKLSGREKTVRSDTTNVSFKDCGGSCTGDINGAKYAIKLPKKWNGSLLLYSHGYRFAQPGPTGLRCGEHGRAGVLDR